MFTQLAEQKKTKKLKDAFLKKLINSFCRQSFIDFGILKNKIDQNFARISIGKVSFIKSQGISRVKIKQMIRFTNCCAPLVLVVVAVRCCFRPTSQFAAVRAGPSSRLQPKDQHCS